MKNYHQIIIKMVTKSKLATVCTALHDIKPQVTEWSLISYRYLSQHTNAYIHLFKSNNNNSHLLEKINIFNYIGIKFRWKDGQRRK